MAKIYVASSWRNQHYPINPIIAMKLHVPVLFVFISVICSSCGVKAKPTENEQALIESIQEILSVKKQLADTYWAEFDQDEHSAPVIFYADSACYVLNPKRKFLNEFECTKLDVKDFDLYRTKPLDSLQFHMETHVELDNDTTFYGRTPYVRCSTLEIVRETNEMYSDNTWWIPMVMHEMVHGCQDSHREYYIARGKVNYCVFEFELSQYPIKYPWLLDALIQENDMILSALNTSSDEERHDCIHQFLSIRKARKAEMTEKLGVKYVQLEEEFETAESLARFFEVQSAIMLGNKHKNFKEDSWFFADAVEVSYFFVTGYNLVRLFVKLGIDLDLPYQNKEHSALEDYLVLY